MLCLLVIKRLSRRTLTQKLHLCRNNKAVFEGFDTQYGKIFVYTLFSYKKTKNAEKALRNALSSPIYTHTSPIPEEYIKKAVIKKGIDYLKKNKNKTVFISFDNISVVDLTDLCRYSSKVYTTFDLSENDRGEIYRLCGTFPVFTKSPIVCDLCLDRNFPLKINLPENLALICPKEFSAELFAGLLYKENGRFII